MLFSTRLRARRRPRVNNFLPQRRGSLKIHDKVNFRLTRVSFPCAERPRYIRSPGKHNATRRGGASAAPGESALHLVSPEGAAGRASGGGRGDHCTRRGAGRDPLAGRRPRRVCVTLLESAGGGRAGGPPTRTRFNAIYRCQSASLALVKSPSSAPPSNQLINCSS